jgi:hypothetical protein
MGNNINSVFAISWAGLLVDEIIRLFLLLFFLFFPNIEKKTLEVTTKISGWRMERLQAYS